MDGAFRVGELQLLVGAKKHEFAIVNIWADDSAHPLSPRLRNYRIGDDVRLVPLTSIGAPLLVRQSGDVSEVYIPVEYRP